MTRLHLGGAAAVAVAVIGGAVLGLLPTASITLSVPTTRVEAVAEAPVLLPAGVAPSLSPAAAASPAATAAPAPSPTAGQTVPTDPLRAELVSIPSASLSKTVPTTGKQPAIAATGTVNLGYAPCFNSAVTESCPSPPPARVIPSGTVVATCPGTPPNRPCPHPAIEFVTTQQAVLTLTASTNAVTIPIRAAEAGTRGNVPAGAIGTIVSPGFPLSEYEVSNPQATGGGADEFGVAVAQQDIDAARAALAAELRAQQAKALLAEAASRALTLVGTPDAGSHLTTDHQVGDRETSITVTLSVDVKVLGLPTAELRDRAVSALRARARTGQLVVPASVSWDQPLLLSVSQGYVALLVARGVTSAVDPAVAARLAAGLTPSSARARLSRAYAASRVTISQWPIPLPWLPLIPSRVSVSVAV